MSRTFDEGQRTCGLIMVTPTQLVLAATNAPRSVMIRAGQSQFWRIERDMAISFAAVSLIYRLDYSARL